MPRISKTKALSLAQEVITEPTGGGNTWTFSYPVLLDAGEISRVHVSEESYQAIRHRRKLSVAQIALELMGYCQVLITHHINQSPDTSSRDMLDSFVRKHGPPRKELGNAAEDYERLMTKKNLDAPKPRKARGASQ